MQATDYAVVESPAMARAYRSGKRARRIILNELRRRQGGEAPSLAELAELVDLGEGAVRYHLKWLAAHGQAEWTPGEPRSAKITDAGLDSLAAI